MTDESGYRALQLDGETDSIVFGCGDRCAMSELGGRFTGGSIGLLATSRTLGHELDDSEAVVRSFRLIPCCRAHPDAGLMCHTDGEGDEDIDRQRLVLALALARAEGEGNVATWLATRLVDTETQFPPGVARMLLEYVAR